MIKVTQTYFDLKLLVFLREMLVFWEKVKFIKLLTFLRVGDCLFFFCTHVWGKEGVFCYLVALSSVCLISLMSAWHVQYIDSETSL